MAFWIFKCDPSKYRLLDRLADPERRTTWAVTRFRDEISPDDTAFIWITGAERGIRAVLRIQSAPQQMPELDHEQRYLSERDTQEKVRVVCAIEQPQAGEQVELLQEEIHATPGLENLSVFHGYRQATNFRVSADEGRILLRLIADRLNSSPIASPNRQTKVSGYNTNLAAEFHALSMLHRLGYDAALSLGNKKAVDITVIPASGNPVTIDVKGLAGTTGWPVDNAVTDRPGHFIVFVCFAGKIADPAFTPECFVVPAAELAGLTYFAPGGRKVAQLGRMRREGLRFRDVWHLLGPSADTFASCPDL